MIATVLLLSAVVAPPSAAGRAAPRWGREGHRLVAALAATLLRPEARAKVDSLLDGNSMAAVSSWADSIRRFRRETAPLHYVDIPLDATAYDSARDCPAGRCIITAIAEERRVLADTAAPPAARAEALRFLIHFLGDLEQPLHCENHDDRGGNSVRVTLFGRPTNLHAVWDSGLLHDRGLTEAALFDSLRATLDTANLRQIASGTVVQWAEQAHDLARRAYAEVPPDDSLGARYERTEIGVVDAQLIRGAVRLAVVLNNALAPKPSASAP